MSRSPCGRIQVAYVWPFPHARGRLPCKARNFVSTAPEVTAKVGKVISVGTSSWISGQAAAQAGERSIYTLVNFERAAAKAQLSADGAF